MDIFAEALENLNSLRDIAEKFIANPNDPIHEDVKDNALDNVIQLRRAVIEATRRTEMDRASLDTAAQKEGVADVALLSYRGRIRVMDDEIKRVEKTIDDHDRRVLLEEANGKLTTMKKRVSVKSEMMEEREWKLREWQKELTPVLKLGTATTVTEFDQAERVDTAFAALPQTLQYLYGQLRNAKHTFQLPIEVSIVAKPKIASRTQDTVEFDPSPRESSMALKKQRFQERKLKHGPDEKRRKRWYESIVGKDLTPFEEWITPQRSLMSSLHQPSIEARNKAMHSTNVSDSYRLLLDLADDIKKHLSAKKQPKRRKHRHATSTIVEDSVQFPLPIPPGELCVEVKLFDGKRNVATLLFVHHDGLVRLSSTPDWLLPRTVKQIDSAASWNPESTAATSASSPKSVAAVYGYPFQWVQELCGVNILKKEREIDLTVEELQVMNLEMMQQQELISSFIRRAKSQAMDLAAFRSGIQALKAEVQQDVQTEEKQAELVRFQQLRLDKLENRVKEVSGVRTLSAIAAGTWAVAMKKLKTENGNALCSSEDPDTQMKLDDNSVSRERFRIRFYPQSQHDTGRKLYYESSEQASFRNGQFEMVPSNEAANTETVMPSVIVGPITSDEIGSHEDLLFGQLVIQKAVWTPKRFGNALSSDYKTRFFPFELHTKQHDSSVDLMLSDQDKEMYRVFRIVLQYGHIQLSALMRVNLIAPLSPMIFVESVIASATKKRQTVGQINETKGKAASEVKNKADHVKTERERIMKRETEAMKAKDNLERTRLQLKRLDQEDDVQKKRSKTPTFWCEDAKITITRKMARNRGLTPEDAVRKLQDLLVEWCRDNSKGIDALNSFLATGSSTKQRKREPSARHRRQHKGNREQRKERQGGDRQESMLTTPTHDEELEQGEIPSIPKKHAKVHRNRSRRESASHDLPYKDNQRSRSVSSRVRPSLSQTDLRDQNRNSRYSLRTPIRGGNMRMDAETPRDRSKTNSATNRMRR